MGQKSRGFCGWSPHNLGKFDSIFIVVDRLTMSTHLIPVRLDYNAAQLDKIYMKEIVRLNGVPLSIISNCVSFSPPCFEEFCMMNCVKKSLLVQPFILGLLDSGKELFKCWKTC